MRKVGILSMQRIANYGSFLQAYGLRAILEEIGAKVEFVDYHPGKCLVYTPEGYGLSRKISKVLEIMKCGAPLKEKIRFIRYKKSYAAQNYPYLGISEKMNYAPELDLLVIGSDEVFNCVQNNTNVGFSPELFGAGNHAKQLISYAASFGNTTLKKLEQYNVKQNVCQWLGAFNALSVRDANSGEIVSALTGTPPQYHLDPVLAYDFIGKCKEIPAAITKEKYMILYGYSGRFSKAECRAIQEYAKEKGLKIFCIGGVQECCDRFVACNPFEVIAYFKQAQAVVTDTFHGTILSVITHKNFAVVVRSNGYGNSEKLLDLLGRLGLEARKIEKMPHLKSLLAKPIAYKEADEIILKERERTYRYLKEKLNA